MLWSIGDGNITHIWEEKWIPRPTSLRVLPRVSLLPKEANVKELIDANTCTWKEDTIFQIFSRAKAELILSLPINMFEARDERTWWLAKNGIF